MRNFLLGLIIVLATGGLASCGGGGTTPPPPPPPPAPPPPPPAFGVGPADCVGGLADGYPCNAIKLAKNIPLADFGADSGNDVWGWTDPNDGTEYALMGLNNGTAFVRISDPQNPVLAGHLPTNSSNASWRDIKVYQNHAYIVADNAGAHGMQVFDLTRLRASSTNTSFTADAVYTNVNSAHSVIINEDSGFAYITGATACGGGLHMVDISAPASPVFVACHAADGYTHDGQCVNYTGPDADYTGAEICFNANEDTVDIVDVSVKAAPVSVSSNTYPNVEYAHQVWLDDSQTYLFVGDELDESRNGGNTKTMVFDVTDLDNPAFLYAHQGTTPATDHNAYIVGNKVYQANYRAGLQVLEFTNLATDTLTQVASFDTFPADDNPPTSGAWSVYPFFPSGTILVSDINRGLFILTPE